MRRSKCSWSFAGAERTVHGDKQLLAELQFQELIPSSVGYAGWTGSAIKATRLIRDSDAPSHVTTQLGCALYYLS